MKRIYKISKRLIAIFMLLLLCINTYANTSSYDGTSFVTKAEFDSLVNIFNEQMNVYQSGLNTRIDTAVASYISGLSQESFVAQTMLINSVGDKYKFTNEWKLWSDTDDCQLGDKLKYDISVIVYAFGVGNYARLIEWTATASRTTGSTDSHYVLVSKSKYNGNKYTIAGRMKSSMVSSARGAQTYGSLGSNTGTPGQISPADYYDNSNSDCFGSNNMNVSGNIFGYSASFPVTVSYSNEDSIESNIAMKEYVSGGTVPTGKTLYLVVDTEINKKKNNKRDVKGEADSGWCKSEDSDSSGWNRRYSASNPYKANYKVTGYYHDYKEIAASEGYTTFIIDAVSSVANMDTTYHNGLPLFKATDNGVAYLEFTLTGSENTTHTFEIKGEQFGNTTIAGGITGLSNAEYSYIDDQGNVIKNVPEIPTGKTVSAKFDCVRDKTYWIKVNPSAGVTTVKATSIKISKNQ